MMFGNDGWLWRLMIDFNGVDVDDVQWLTASIPRQKRAIHKHLFKHLMKHCTVQPPRLFFNKPWDIKAFWCPSTVFESVAQKKIAASRINQLLYQCIRLKNCGILEVKA